MIARIWRGATAADRAQEYLEYLKQTGVADYTATPGNHGVQILLRTDGDRTDFTILSYWESMDAIKAFAGDQPEVSRYYPEDDEYLIDKQPNVEHHQVAELRRR
jgi:heme-degrading monooxygenase HmoA